MDYLSANFLISGFLIKYMSLRSLQDMEELPASLQPEAVLTGSPYGAPAPPSIPPGHRLLTGPAYASCNELLLDLNF